jgi:hypothetical protein
MGEKPDDPARGWHGTVRDGLPTLRMLYAGDCGFRCMELAHTLRGPVGWPAATAEKLLANGVGFEFSHDFSVTYDALPTMEVLQRRCRLTGDPDVIAIQLGATYGRRVIISDTHRMVLIRDDVKRRLGRHVSTGYKLLRPWVRRFGRHNTPYPGPADFDRFVREVRELWPSATVVVMPPFPRTHYYPTAEPIMVRADADQKDVAARYGAQILEFYDVIGVDKALRCASNYNLNSCGSGLVGERVADWLLEHESERLGLASGALQT